MPKNIMDLLINSEFKNLTLEEIASEEISVGSEIYDIDLNKGDDPAIYYKNLENIGISFTGAPIYIDEKKINKKRYCSKGDLLILNTSPKLEEIGKSTAYLGDKDLLVSYGIIVIKHQQDPKYLAYAISTDFCKKQIIKRSNKSSGNHISITAIKKIKVPIPPMNIQNLIVKYLDKFHDLSKALKDEGELRARQGDYYKELFIVTREKVPKNLKTRDEEKSSSSKSLWGLFKKHH